MKTLLNKVGLMALAAAIVISFTNCEAVKNANNTQKGAAIGVAAGSILGAVLGNNIGKGGKSEIGAVIGAAVGGAAGAIIGKKMDNQAKKIEAEVPGAEVERVEDGIVITFDGEDSGVRFDTNKYNITAESQVTLDKLAAILMEFPDTDVLVVGHTDSVGADEYNMTLSKNRAQSVTNYFVQNKGLSSGRFTTHWYGETQPVASNDTPEGRAANRRVNIVIVPNEKMEADAKREAGN